MRAEVAKGFGGVVREFEEGASERECVTEDVKQNDVVDRKRKKRVSFACKICQTILDGCIYDRSVIELVRDILVVPLEEVLVDAVVFVEELERRFEALCQAVKRVPIQALVVDAPNFKDDTEIPRLGEKDMGIDKHVKSHLLVERTHLRLILVDALKPKHQRSSEYKWG